MNNLLSYISYLNVIDVILIFCILLVLLIILTFIIVILFSRFQDKRSEIFKIENIEHINQILFAIGFDGEKLNKFTNDPKFNKNWKKKIYRQLFLTELIKLHRLYDGDIALNLRKCYVDFRLIQISYAKIRSWRWEIKCAGIQELSEMEIKNAIPVIMKLTKSKNETLKMVALTHVIHLMGLEGLTLLKDYKESLNDWIQLNLLESIKEENISVVPDFGYLLKSENESIVVFGLRLINLFHQNQNLNIIKTLQKNASRKIQMEAEKTFIQLSTVSKSLFISL